MDGFHRQDGHPACLQGTSSKRVRRFQASVVLAGGKTEAATVCVGLKELYTVKGHWREHTQWEVSHVHGRVFSYSGVPSCEEAAVLPVTAGRPYPRFT